MKLSERLQSLADYFSPEEMFHSRALVLEAMELAKRYEDAPVIGLYGQRVRILLDTEG